MAERRSKKPAGTIGAPQAQVLLLHELNTAPYPAAVAPVDVAFHRVFVPVAEH